MKIKAGDIIIMYDDPKFFYIIQPEYRYKIEYAVLGSPIYSGQPGEPEPNTKEFECTVWCSASNMFKWASFAFLGDNHLRMATPEEKTLINIFVDIEKCLNF